MREAKYKSRYLRRNQTKPEAKLWKYIRNRQLLGFKFRRQYPIGNYILDFYCPEKKLAIELDGDQHMSDIDTLESDQTRDKILNSLGIKVLRFPNSAFSNLDNVLSTIVRELD